MPYLWHNNKLSAFLPISKEDVFGALIQLQSITQSIRLKSSVVGVSKIVSVLTEEMYHAVRYLSITFVSNLKRILCSNTIYTLEDIISCDQVVRAASFKWTVVCVFVTRQ